MDDRELFDHLNEIKEIGYVILKVIEKTNPEKYKEVLKEIKNKKE